MRLTLLSLAAAAAAMMGYASLAASSAVDEVALKASAPITQRTVRAPANVVNFNGTNVGGPEWTRPFADGTCCSGLGPVRLSTQLFSLSTTDTCDLESTQDGYDGYLFVYRAPFSPTNQTVNFIAGDDDGDGGIGTSNIDGVLLNGNTTYVVVTTGFENGEEGNFANSISCPTATVRLGAFVAAPAIPLPTFGTTGLAVLGGLVLLAGVFAARMRH